LAANTLMNNRQNYGTYTPPERGWCHQCAQEVVPLHPGQLVCPRCHGEFVERLEPSSNSFDHPSNFVPSFNSGSEPQHYNQIFNNNPFEHIVQQIQASFQGIPQSTTGNGPNIFFQNNFFQSNFGDPNNNPLLQMANTLLQQLMGGGGVGYGNNFVGNIGDYVFGSAQNLEQILAELYERSQPKPPPPASKEALKHLKTLTIAQEHVDKKLDCGICKDEYAVGDEVKQLPCEHFFHRPCIEKWLTMSNSCPLCRFELPTDDAEYERMRKSREENNNNSQSNGNNNNGNTNSNTSNSNNNT